MTQISPTDVADTSSLAAQELLCSGPVCIIAPEKIRKTEIIRGTDNAMKLLIASDIHGSALYCGQLLDAFDREEADRLLLLGDILYHGPRNDLPGWVRPEGSGRCPERPEEPDPVRAG